MRSQKSLFIRSRCGVWISRVVGVIFVLVHGLLKLRTNGGINSGTRAARCGTYHFKKLVTLVQMRHDDALPFWDSPINPYELSLFPHRINLIQR